jgi:hypothetical protein
MKLEDYKTLEEKEKDFNMISGTARIHYETEKFFGLLEEFYSYNLLSPKNPTYAFRGQSEAKYKLYNSAQRYFYGNGINQLNKKIYEGPDSNKKLRFFIDWTTLIMTEGLKWQGAVIPKILNQQTTDFKDSILTVCSYLRHYGVPTPFLDFSQNPFIALFFAIEEAYYMPSNNEIENYVSLYVFDIKLSQHYAEYFETTGFYNVYLKPLECYNLFKIWTNNNSNIFTNINIINQEGCLISNIMQNDSLEMAYNIFIDEYDKGITLKKNKLITCYNIHKGLIPLIRKKLKEKGITKEFIYPDPYLIKEVTDKATIELLKKE